MPEVFAPPRSFAGRLERLGITTRKDLFACAWVCLETAPGIGGATIAKLRAWTDKVRGHATIPEKHSPNRTCPACRAGGRT